MYRQRNPQLDYTHDIVSPARPALCGPVKPKPEELGLTARLRCLKALYDLERDAGSSRAEACPRAH